LPDSSTRARRNNAATICSDEEVIVMTVGTLRDSFEETALPHHDVVYRANLRITGDPTTAQDLTQETYLRAFRSFSSFQSGTNCRAWLLQIAHNVFCRDYRQRKRMTWRTADDDEFDQLALVPGQMPDPEEEVLRQLDRDELRHALAQLPETFRTAIVLVELQGLSCEEAAAVMGTPRGTVLSRLYRGRARLRQILEKVFA
jgi:RNA polymerase sigma-70 factor (ECF subfamily)